MSCGSDNHVQVMLTTVMVMVLLMVMVMLKRMRMTPIFHIDHGRSITYSATQKKDALSDMIIENLIKLYNNVFYVV